MVQLRISMTAIVSALFVNSLTALIAGCVQPHSSHPADESSSGYIDKRGTIRLPMSKWLVLEPFQEGLAAVSLTLGDIPAVTLDGKSVSNGAHFIDERGRLAIERPDIDNARNFRDGLAAASKGSHWGFIDREGQTAIPFEFEEVKDFHNGYAAVRRGGKWGFIDKSGTTAVPARFDSVDSFEDGFAPASVGKVGLIDTSGTWVIQPAFDHVGRLSDGRCLAIELSSRTAKYIDSTGRTWLQLNFDRWKQAQSAAQRRILKFANSFFEIREDIIPSGASSANFVKNLGFKGKVIDVFMFSEGTGLACSESELFFADRTGKRLFPCQGEFAFPQREGKFIIFEHDRCFVAGKSGKRVGSADFDFAFPFSEDMCATLNGSSWSFLDAEGQVAIPKSFSSANSFSSGLAPVNFATP